MLSASLLLTLNGILYGLKLSSGSGSFPKPLTSAQEKEYLEKAAAGDKDARNVLIERNLRLVAHVVKKYYAQTDEQEDLISIGTIGLIKGISTFDHTKGAKLGTYAARCIENEILMYFRSRRKSAGDVSLSDSIETGKDGNSLSIMDVVCSDENMFDDLCSRELASKLTGLIQTQLEPREQEIVRLRYGLEGHSPLTQREIAAAMGISRSYVSRIEKKALKKLELCLEGQN